MVTDNYIEYSLPGEVFLPGKPIYSQDSVPFSSIQSLNEKPSVVNISEPKIIGYTPSRAVEGVYEIGVKPSSTGNIELIQHRFFRPNE